GSCRKSLSSARPHARRRGVIYRPRVTESRQLIVRKTIDRPRYFALSRPPARGKGRPRPRAVSTENRRDGFDCGSNRTVAEASEAGDGTARGPGVERPRGRTDPE